MMQSLNANSVVALFMTFIAFAYGKLSIVLLDNETLLCSVAFLTFTKIIEFT